MKKQFLYLLLLITGAASAQKSQDPCLEKSRQIDSLYQIGQFQSALPLFDDARKTCNDQRGKFFVQGGELLKFRIGREKDQEAKAKLIKDLLAYYDENARLVPSESQAAGVRKAMAMQNYQMGSEGEIFAVLDKSFTTSPDSFTDPEATLLYFRLYHEKFKSGDKTVSLADLLAKQDAIDALLSRQSGVVSEKDARPYKQVSRSMGKMVKADIDCKKLSEYYLSAFEAHKSDTIWLNVAATRLTENSCTSDPAFLTIATEAHKVKPTARTAYGLGVAYQRTGKSDLAARYLEESAELETNVSEKASRYFVLGTSVYKGKDNAKAKASLLKALKLEPTMGKVWLSLAQMYASASKTCGTTPFEKKALNLLAAETALKATSANPKMKEAAEATAKKFQAQAPSADEIKEAGMKGKTVTFGCWINESVTLKK